MSMKPDWADDLMGDLSISILNDDYQGATATIRKACISREFIRELGQLLGKEDHPSQDFKAGGLAALLALLEGTRPR